MIFFCSGGRRFGSDEWGSHRFGGCGGKHTARMSIWSTNDTLFISYYFYEDICDGHHCLKYFVFLKNWRHKIAACKESDIKILLPTKDSDICFIFSCLRIYAYLPYAFVLLFIIVYSNRDSIKATTQWNNTSTEQPFKIKGTVIINKAHSE